VIHTIELFVQNRTNLCHDDTNHHKLMSATSKKSSPIVGAEKQLKMQREKEAAAAAAKSVEMDNADFGCEVDKKMTKLRAGDSGSSPEGVRVASSDSGMSSMLLSTQNMSRHDITVTEQQHPVVVACRSVGVRRSRSQPITATLEVGNRQN